MSGVLMAFISAVSLIISGILIFILVIRIREHILKIRRKKFDKIRKEQIKEKSKIKYEPKVDNIFDYTGRIWR